MLARFQHRIDVRFADTDAQGHVFFANYLTYFDESLTAYLRAIDCPWKQLYAGGLDIVYVESRCRHLGRSFFEDQLSIATRIVHIGETSITTRFYATRDGSSPDGRPPDGTSSDATSSNGNAPAPASMDGAALGLSRQPVAEGQLTSVCIHKDTKEKLRCPDQLRLAIEAYEGSPLPAERPPWQAPVQAKVGGGES